MEFVRWCRLQWDRVGGALAVVIGAVLLVVGWAQVSATPYAGEQIPYVISCGLTGIFLLGLGAVLWHSADLRDQWRKLDRLEERLERAFPQAERPASRGQAVPDGVAGVDLTDEPTAARSASTKAPSAARPAR